MSRSSWRTPVTLALFIAACAACGSKPPSPKAEAPAGHPHEEHPARLTIDLEQQRANQFAFAEASIQSTARTIQTTGTIGPNETRVAHMRPLSRGRILRVRVRMGDRVKKGEELLAYDNVELGETVHEYLRALMDLEQTKTQAEVAKRALERATDLAEVGALAKAELDRRDAEYRRSQATIQAQRAEVARFDERLHRFGLEEQEIEGLLKKNPQDYHREASTTMLKAPFDGIVLKANAAEGESIQPEDKLFDVVDTSSVWVQADLYPQDVASVREGDNATVYVEGYPEEKFRGRIAYVSDVVNPETRATRVRVELPNPDRRLKLDMFATIQLPSRQQRAALLIPVNAVQQVDGKSVVFVREQPQQFEMREVKLGPESQGAIEVLSGLKTGETVVTRGSFVLKSEHMKSELGEEGHAH
jgi:membrane fusion protein, heavy metal efflux system